MRKIKNSVPSSENDVFENKPLFQANLNEVKEIISIALREAILESKGMPEQKTGRKVYGVKAIANELGVSVSSVNRLLKSKKIDGAVSRVGKTIVADVDALHAIFKCNKFLKCA